MKTVNEFFRKLKLSLEASASKFPIALISGILIALLAIVKIDTSDFMRLVLSIAQVALLFNIALSITLVTYSKNINNKINKKNRIIIGVISPIIIYALVYFLGSGPYQSGIEIYNNFQMLTLVIYPKTIYIILASIAILVVLYLRIQAKYRDQDHFERSFFILNRSLYSAAFFFIVMALGSFLVVSAYEALIGSLMILNIYEYLLIISGLLAYLIFLAYLANEEDGLKDLSENKFIKILFTNILTIIILALGVVLVLWVITLLLGAEQVQFETLVMMVNIYLLLGLWVFINNDNYQSTLVSAYKLIYPLILIITLTFELWTILNRYSIYGIQTMEYAAILMAIFGLITAIFILLKRKQVYTLITGLMIILLLISILPLTGLYNLPYYQQNARLKNVLNANSMLVDGNLVANAEIDDESKFIITDAVDYILKDPRKDYNSLLSDLVNENSFKDRFGFMPVYHLGNQGNYNYITYELADRLIDLSDYNYVLRREAYGQINEEFIFVNKNYKVTLLDDKILKVYLNNKIILEESLDAFFDNIIAEGNKTSTLDLATMSIAFELADLDIYLVFDYLGLSYADDQLIEFDYRVPNIYFNFK